MSRLSMHHLLRGSAVLVGLFLAACSSDNKATTDGGTSTAQCTALPPLAAKSTYKVGFAQTSLEGNNPWRVEESRSMQAEAEKRGYEYHYYAADDVSEQAQVAQSQVANIQKLIDEKVDVLFIAPTDETVVAPSIVKARNACIPVFLLDRNVNNDVAKAGSDYVSFLGSDFELQGKLDAQWLVAKAAGAKLSIIELEGVAGATPTIGRKKGFDDSAKAAGLTIVASQSAEFNRAKGQEVAKQLIPLHPEATVIYAHNDEMAIGAIAAIKELGKKPSDYIILSIDGAKVAFDAIAAGELSSTVTSSPSFGPLAFDTMGKYAAGDTIPAWVIVADKQYDSTNYKDGVATAF